MGGAAWAASCAWRAGGGGARDARGRCSATAPCGACSLGCILVDAWACSGVAAPCLTLRFAQLARASRVLSLAADAARATGPRVALWSAEDVQALTEVAQHVRRVYEEEGGGEETEKQRHLQGVCLRLLRALTAVQRRDSKEAID